MNSGSYFRTVFVFISGITTLVGFAGGGAGFFTSGFIATGGGGAGATFPGVVLGAAGLTGVVGVTGILPDTSFADSTSFCGRVASEYGPQAAVSAPFYADGSTWSSNGYVGVCGTGIAMAHVVGVLALMVDIYPTASSSTLIAKL